jgi:hypothetical protein
MCLALPQAMPMLGAARTYWPIKFLFIDAIPTAPGQTGIKVQKEKFRQIAQGAM